MLKLYISYAIYYFSFNFLLSIIYLLFVIIIIIYHYLSFYLSFYNQNKYKQTSFKSNFSLGQKWTNYQNKREMTVTKPAISSTESLNQFIDLHYLLVATNL